MSEYLEAAAAAVGAPAELVQRSAEARATADGIPVEEVLKAWAGGGPTPSSPPGVETPPSPPSAPAEAAPPPAAPSPAAPASPPVSAPVAPAPPAPAPVAPAAPPAQPVAAATGPPPVLKGREDRPFRYFFGGAALLILCLVVAVALPTFSDTGRGAFHSEIPYTEGALGGQEEYLAEGCAACHTQLVRPIVADAQLASAAGLGAVTLSDTNQVIGRQRYGPDLANVGSRLTSEAIEAVLSGEGGHILYRGDRMDALVAYLAESRVMTEEEPRE